MRSRHLFLMGLIALPLTLLMAYDFFPSFSSLLSVPKPILIGLLLLILLVGFLINRIQKDVSPKISFWCQVVFSSYLLVLLFVFTLFGGISQVGISLSSPVVWILLVISFFEIIKEYKDLKVNESNA